MRTLTQILGVASTALALSMSAQAGGSHGGGGGGGGGGNASGRSEHAATSHGSDSKAEHGKTEHAGMQHHKPEHAKAAHSETEHAKAHSSKTPSQQLAAKPKLSDKLSKLLPPGTDMSKAADGFKNLGQFVAAVHVSKNLGIPFADLKTRMMDGASLGSAIKTLKPEANADVEVRKARKQSQTQA